MHNQLSMTTDKVHDIVHKTGSISLSDLEHAADASFNLIFLALDRLVSENKIKIRRGEWDYIISRS